MGAKISHLLPFMGRPARAPPVGRDLRCHPRLLADHRGETGAPGFLVTTGWGTWGFKAIPAGGEAMAELIATGQTPPLIASFGLDRFARDHAMADQGSAGAPDAVDRCPGCGGRPVNEYGFGGERRRCRTLTDPAARDLD